MVHFLDDQYNLNINKYDPLCLKSNFVKTGAIDYFNFNFDEGQLYSCWRVLQLNSDSRISYILPESSNIDRLRNLSWRRWSKLKFNLDVLHPRDINWYKECDITFLYGPLVDNSAKSKLELERSVSCTSAPTEDSQSHLKSILKLKNDHYYQSSSVQKSRKSVKFNETVHVRQYIVS